MLELVNIQIKKKPLMLYLVYSSFRFYLLLNTFLTNPL